MSGKVILPILKTKTEVYHPWISSCFHFERETVRKTYDAEKYSHTFGVCTLDMYGNQIL